jgi:lysophospholipase L1-like esterase
MTSGGSSSKHATWKRLPGLVAINLAVTLALWLCLEVVFGFLVQGRVSLLSKVQFKTMTSRDYIIADNEKGYRLQANFSSDDVHTNSEGFRGKELPKDFTKKRLILALGESTTFGWCVADHVTYPHHLEHILNARSAGREFVVVNAGVPSYSSRQVLLYLEQLLARFHPDLVLVSLLWNDLFYSSIEEWTPECLVPAYPSRLHQALFRYSRVYRWMATQPAKPQKVNFYSEAALIEYKANIARIAQLCRTKGVPIVFVEPPFSEQAVPAAGETMWHNRFSKKFVPKIVDRFLAAQLEEAESQRVPFVRHGFGVSERPTEEHFLDFLHVDGEGNRMIAQSIADFLQDQNPWLWQED